MRTVGIIAEYNPFHNGHAHHISMAKTMSKADCCVVCMSGSFVQRGEPACADKYTRALWAIKSGADIVIELPQVAALSSAEYFASAGIRALAETGIITDLSFGTELADLNQLCRAADLLENETGDFKDSLKKRLSEGMSYPRAYSNAMADTGIAPEYVDLLSLPNTVLALEYIRSCKKYAPSFIIHPVKRNDPGYNAQKLNGHFSSATSIRQALRNNDSNYAESVPDYVFDDLTNEYFSTDSLLSAMIMYSMRTNSLSTIRNLPDIAEGFENVLKDAAEKNSTADEFYASVKNKRFTLSRIRRSAMQNLLGITKEDRALIEKALPYIRVLAVKQQYLRIIGKMKSCSGVPVLMRHSDEASCPTNTAHFLEIDSLASDIMQYLGHKVHKDFLGTIIVK